MSADGNALELLASSVADGAPIDWERAEQTASPEERRVVRHLRLVSSVAELYRSLPREEDASRPAPGDAPHGPPWGHLVLLESIGRGTSGEVHRAWDLELQREVALKLFPPDPEQAHQRHGQVLSEARRLARVRHPNVATVYGADRDKDRVGFWMELVHGASLQDLLDRDGPFGAREAALIGIELCGALAAVHAAGLLHRDIKAQNVLREKGGRIVLTDFGTGEEVGAAPVRMAGTPMYLAPEIFAGKPATVQSDLYSLGVLLFHLVTREFPIAARTLPELVRAHKAGSLRHLRDVRPDLPPSFVEVVERLLAPDPTVRFQSAGAVESALRGTLDSTPRAEPVPLAAPPPSAGTRPWFRSRAAAAAAVFLVAIAALVTWSMVGRRQQGAVAPGTIQSIAVLPLEDLTGGEGPPHLSEALTDQLIATLGQLHSLRVTSRTSVMSVEKTEGSLADIARRLNVASVLEGTVALSNGTGGTSKRVRVNARLIAAGTDTQLWSGTFERSLGDSFALQADLARAIAREVNIAVSPRESARLSRRQTTSEAAEAAYFEGQHHLAHYGPENAAQALKAFETAVKLDVNFAPAYVGLARSYIRLGTEGAVKQAEARARALAMTSRALELDDLSAEAHTAAADLKFYYDWNWKGAEQSYEHALDLNPSSSHARQQFARFLAAMGRLNDAALHARRATEVDPLSADAAQTDGLTRYLARRHDDAVAVLGRAYELDPSSAGTHVILSRVRESQKRYDEALAEANRALAIADYSGVRLHAARQMALAGDGAAARAVLAEFSDPQRQARPDSRAYVLLALGETDRALALLEEAEAQRDPGILWLAVDPRVDALRNHPRFISLLQRMGLPTSLDLRRSAH